MIINPRQSSIYHLNNKYISIPYDQPLVLLQVVDDKNYYNSVFIHRDGTVCVEDHDGSLSDSFENKEEFEEVRSIIHNEVENIFCQLIKEKFFSDKGLENIRQDKLTITFYSGYDFYPLYDGIVVDEDFNPISHYYF